MLRIENSLNEKIWREFVEQQPHGNIFHTPEMFQVFARARGHRPLLRAVIDDQGEIHALMTPVEITLRNGIFHRLTSRSIAYGGVLTSACNNGNLALEILLRDYCKEYGRNVLFTELRNLAELGHLQPVMVRCGFFFEDHLNYLIDLNCSPMEILQNIGSRTRKHIRQALNKGNVIVEEMNNPGQLSAWYELICKSYKAAQVPLANRSLFEAAYELLSPNGMIQFWLARIGSKYVAASAELLYKDVIYGWYSGVDREYSNESPGELLMWHVLQYGAMAGYKIYDFGGAGKPGEKYGVRNFKAKFGGKLVCFGRNIKVHSPTLLRISQLGYQAYRRLIGLF